VVVGLIAWIGGWSWVFSAGANRDYFRDTSAPHLLLFAASVLSVTAMGVSGARQLVAVSARRASTHLAVAVHTAVSAGAWTFTWVAVMLMRRADGVWRLAATDAATAALDLLLLLAVLVLSIALLLVAGERRRNVG
jgi:hypothetical protein